ncbi:hypothetical protein [Mycobacterium persicum]|uniref:Uncharacterized protein n=1 Tax=Mycobacterium persicum TaxID=1487726 RepID=A0AB38USH7_9MYCO|nr:hypothetical protein [Mycobacterium persicum]VAZ74997.1 hypothetical protein LAUMK15_02589 [Mycobacterium persicum]VAZ83594.1 hypothetical protein LAUMK42_02411 [Mycobacterium persicum]VAZ92866.1 hypothetical protein LAUMK4_02264 [Mycobacterium persicum]
MTAHHTNPPPPPATGAAAGRRHSTGVVIGATVAGLAIGALAVFAVTGVTWKIRVELPAPLYPPGLSSTPPVSNPPAPPAAPTTAATATPSSSPAAPPAPPLPPLPPGQ